MLIKRTTALAVLWALCALAHSLPFTFQITQFDKSNANVTESSFRFEDIMFGYFFDAGYVVSNLPTTTTDDPEKIPVAPAIQEARDGSLDYLAMVLLVYDKTQNAFDTPVSAAWELYRLSDGKKISSGKLTMKDVPGKDAESTLRNYALIVSRDINFALKKN